MGEVKAQEQKERSQNHGYALGMSTAEYDRGEETLQNTDDLSSESVVQEPNAQAGLGFGEGGTGGEWGGDENGKQIDPKAAKKIEENAQNIIKAANLYQVDPKIIAAVIYTEQAENVNWIDDATDWLAFYGIDMSVGLGQVRMSTAEFLEENGYAPTTKGAEGGWDIPLIGEVPGTITMARQNRLENDEINCYYVAAYIRYFQDLWAESYPDIAEHPEILATLYNIGHDNSDPNENPKANPFGESAAEYYSVMTTLLGIE